MKPPRQAGSSKREPVSGRYHYPGREAGAARNRDARRAADVDMVLHTLLQREAGGAEPPADSWARLQARIAQGEEPAAGRRRRQLPAATPLPAGRRVVLVLTRPLVAQLGAALLLLLAISGITGLVAPPRLPPASTRIAGAIPPAAGAAVSRRSGTGRLLDDKYRPESPALPTLEPTKDDGTPSGVYSGRRGPDGIPLMISRSAGGGDKGPILLPEPPDPAPSYTPRLGVVHE